MSAPILDSKGKLLLDLGDRIARLRYLADLSQVELALMAKISKNYLNDLEHGRRNPSLLVLARVAGALNVSLATLFEGIELPEELRFSEMFYKH